MNESIKIVIDNSLFKYLEKFSKEFYLELINSSMIYHYPKYKENIEKDIIKHKKAYCLFVFQNGIFGIDRVVIKFFDNKNDAEENIDLYIPYKAEVLELQ